MAAASRAPKEFSLAQLLVRLMACLEDHRGAGESGAPGGSGPRSASDPATRLLARHISRRYAWQLATGLHSQEPSGSAVHVYGPLMIPALRHMAQQMGGSWPGGSCSQEATAEHLRLLTSCTERVAAFVSTWRQCTAHRLPHLPPAAVPPATQLPANHLFTVEERKLDVEHPFPQPSASRDGYHPRHGLGLMAAFPNRHVKGGGEWVLLEVLEVRKQAAWRQLQQREEAEGMMRVTAQPAAWVVHGPSGTVLPFPMYESLPTAERCCAERYRGQFQQFLDAHPELEHDCSCSCSWCQPGVSAQLERATAEVYHRCVCHLVDEVRQGASSASHFLKYGPAGRPVQASMEGEPLEVRLHLTPASRSGSIHRGGGGAAAASAAAAPAAAADDAGDDDEGEAAALREALQDQLAAEAAASDASAPPPIQLAEVVRYFAAAISSYLASQCFIPREHPDHRSLLHSLLDLMCLRSLRRADWLTDWRFLHDQLLPHLGKLVAAAAGGQAEGAAAAGAAAAAEEVDAAAGGRRRGRQ